MNYAVGLDIGTTHIKACLTDQTGAILAVSETDNRQEETEQFGRCFRAEALFEKAVFCIRNVIGQAGKIPEAIGITSMAESGVFLDRDGKALLPVISWSEAGDACPLPPGLCGEEFYQRTGLLWHPKYTVSRILCLREKFPELYGKVDSALSVADYILYRLCGKKCTDESLACRTGMYDIVRQSWWTRMTDFAGMTGKLPEVLRGDEGWPVLAEDAYELLGLRERGAGRSAEAKGFPESSSASSEGMERFWKRTSEQSGMAQEIRVRVCGHDHLCAAVGAGVQGSEVFHSMGTSEVYIGWLDGPGRNDAFYEKGIQQGRFGGRRYWICNMPSSGASVEWFRMLLSTDEKITYEALMAEKGQIPSPVSYLPFVNGTGTHRMQQGMQTGAVLGLKGNTGRGDILQGIYEGIAMESRYILGQLAAVGIDTRQLIVVGGGSKNRCLMQAKADVTGSTFLCCKTVQAAAAGAAALAGGFMVDGRELAYRAEARAEYEAAYREKYEKYRNLCRVLCGE